MKRVEHTYDFKEEDQAKIHYDEAAGRTLDAEARKYEFERYG